MICKYRSFARTKLWRAKCASKESFHKFSKQSKSALGSGHQFSESQRRLDQQRVTVMSRVPPLSDGTVTVSLAYRQLWTVGDGAYTQRLMAAQSRYHYCHSHMAGLRNIHIHRTMSPLIVEFSAILCVSEVFSEMESVQSRSAHPGSASVPTSGNLHRRTYQRRDGRYGNDADILHFHVCTSPGPNLMLKRDASQRLKILRKPLKQNLTPAGPFQAPWPW